MTVHSFDTTPRSISTTSSELATDMQTDRTILIAGNDRKSRDLVSAYLTYQGYEIITVDDPLSLFDTVTKHHTGIVIAELGYLATSVPDFRERVKNAPDFLALILFGSKEEISTQPPSDEQVFFLHKPLNLDELESIVMRAKELQMMKQLGGKSDSLKYPSALCSTIIGRSKSMLKLFEMIEKVAESNATVLIQGESGTGKELAARAIHQLSGRSNKNFVPINCAAIPDDLLESELFGHVKGSFTGAYTNRMGRFEMADKGTLFLDEIGDMKAALQVKLLRVLQTREFEPVGSTKSQKVDVRIIAATNKNLEEMVSTKDFREDLYYRLSVIPISIPPLRGRIEDIPLLIHNFLSIFNADHRYSVKGFTREALDILCCYEWPGNVRELENLVERLVIIKNSGFITPDDLPEKYRSGSAAMIQPPCLPESEDFPQDGICLNSAVDQFENRLILQALARTGGNKKEAAALLNLKRTTLIEKLKKKNLAYVEE